MQSMVGVLKLEGLMSRGQILFTNGFKFRGKVDLERLQASFSAVVEQIRKFQYRLEYDSQDNIRWVASELTGDRFLTIESDDIDEAFREFCSDSADILERAGNFPMVLAVIRHREPEKNDSFIIAQLSDHTYLDNRSSALVFDNIVQHYNAAIQGDSQRARQVLATVGRLHTLSAPEMIEILTDESVDHHANSKELMTYPLADEGSYNIPISELPDRMERYRKEKVKPLIRFFDLNGINQACRGIFPQVSRNSIACAALAKGVYLLNTQTRDTSDTHQITIKMVVDLLSPEQRTNYIGNYIAFVPVTVNGEKSVAEIAKEIDDRVREIKTTRQDVTAFSMAEAAAEQGFFGTADEPMSVIATNWNNYHLLENPHDQYLSGCRWEEHISGVNVAPKCTVGGVLINKPVAVINLSRGDKLCFSFFPSLRSQQENSDLMERIEQVFRMSVPE